ncbi:hypothetical protein CC1G_12141 [Coprinopsis cinerea okayama7|uniref:Ricin B lectin domain-containing protein n=1 Tax=Coprinopsis cinerea (strain Okayama-7 / 130 / ATCC MYA-4618 / FGSC 9003) TaxID=240176 RepID=A8P6Y0_COPC7|nr:hypothetical protein CC1G_12141 [Coprinopsis cinerea okayama7\|eukprot:XP_001839250.2 hypothetical protein CC1G_12141 [Coprinopsis cinerea okayama7\
MAHHDQLSASLPSSSKVCDKCLSSPSTSHRKPILNYPGAWTRKTPVNPFLQLFSCQYLECKYTWEDGQGVSTVNYCWYDYRNYTLYHYPNTPLPVDSHVACPAKLDIATVYRIRSSLDYNKCITAMDVKDGVQQNGVRLQSWTCAQGNRNQQFVHWQNPNFLVIPEDHINWMPFNWLCVDLTDGKLENGTPVQMWACNYQNPNQPVVWI